MLEQINSCLEFTLQATAIIPHSLLIDAKNITLNQNQQYNTLKNSYNLFIQSDFLQSENYAINESFVINEVQQKQNNQICIISEKNEEDEDSNLIQKQQHQQQNQKSLKEQILEKIQNKSKKQLDQCPEQKLSYTPQKYFQNTSKSPIQKNKQKTPQKQQQEEFRINNKENNMPTIHKKQFSQGLDQKLTCKKEYLPFKSERFTITPSRQSHVNNQKKQENIPTQQQRHSLKQEFKNGISHIKLNLYKY